jgi:hypothetical protein
VAYRLPLLLLLYCPLLLLLLLALPPFRAACWLQSAAPSRLHCQPAGC